MPLARELGYPQPSECRLGQRSGGHLRPGVLGHRQGSRLDDGKSRLVLVSDEAPHGPLRLITYMESVTSDCVLIELVTVPFDRIGVCEVIVPRRVNAGGRLVEVPADRSPEGTLDGWQVDGVEGFNQSAAAARENLRPQVQ